MQNHESIQQGDILAIEIGSVLIEAKVIDVTGGIVTVKGDEISIEYLKAKKFEEINLEESCLERLQLLAGILDEAKYQGREVPLGKPMVGDVKKSKVYVRGPKGNVVKVNFGDKKMKIKKSNPKRRKSFRARHRCENPGPRWKARYWSCRAW